MTAEATAEERLVIDRALDEFGALRAPLADTAGHPHVAFGGFHQADSQRHMLLPSLLAVQDAIGWVSEGALGYLSEQLAVPPADTYGVATFYALIATEPRPGRMVHICDDIACRLAGVDEIKAELEREFGPGAATSGDAGWASSPCLGRCERAPAAFIQDTAAGPSTATGFDLTGALALLSGDVPARAEVSLAAPQLVDSSDAHLLSRIGTVPPTLEEYRASGGYLALERAVTIGPTAIIGEIDESGILGRGGAAFPMGLKWRGAADEPGPRYLVCNADESEPGTFKDRVLLEGDPFAVIEAMTIAAFAIGAEQGYIYIRGEYPEAITVLEDSLAAARAADLLGGDVGGYGFAFDIEIRRGGGAYICGEETALFNSIEGRRGEPRQKPPFPTEAGLFGRPTVVNNVETLANVPRIIIESGAGFARTGTRESTGTKLFCLSGHVTSPGVYEVPFGATIRHLLELAGGVTGDLRAVLLGGAAGVFVGPDQLDVPLTFEGTRDAGVPMGSGVVMAFNTSTDFTAITARIAEFFRDESCGQCVPCRVGTVRQEEALHALGSGGGEIPMTLLVEIDQVMRDASICGLGQTAGSAIQSALRLGLIGGGP
jgi:NADH-quinone oxidoreductase subunit F